MDYYKLEQISLQLKELTQQIDELLQDAKSADSDPYPYKGTWRDKIIYILKYLKSPLTAKEIIQCISNLEKRELDASAENSIVQICSNMAREIPPELEAEGNYNKKYSLPKKEANG